MIMVAIDILNRVVSGKFTTVNLPGLLNLPAVNLPLATSFLPFQIFFGQKLIYFLMFAFLLTVLLSKIEEFLEISKWKQI